MITMDLIIALYIHMLVKMKNCFVFFQIPITYPATAPEIAIPELDGKTAKMYRYGNDFNFEYRIYIHYVTLILKVYQVIFIFKM